MDTLVRAETIKEILSQSADLLETAATLAFEEGDFQAQAEFVSQSSYIQGFLSADLSGVGINEDDSPHAVSDYRLLWGSTSKELTEKVGALLPLGYTPIGGASSSSARNDDGEVEHAFTQALVRLSRA